MRPIDADALVPLIQRDKIEGETLSIIKALGEGLQAETLNLACDRHIKIINSLPTIEAELMAIATAPTIEQKQVYNQVFAEIVKNCSICHNCDIYRDAWNVCFVASECLTNDFKFRKQRKDSGEDG